MRFFIFFMIGTFILSQIYAPIIATRIRKRLRELGYEMRSSLFATLFNDLSFWKEARTINKKYDDPYIRLEIKKFWVYFSIPFLFLFILVIYAGYHISLRYF